MKGVPTGCPSATSIGAYDDSLEHIAAVEVRVDIGNFPPPEPLGIFSATGFRWQKILMKG